MVNSGAADAKCEPVLIGSFDVTASGTGTRMLVGDLDGDGRMDLLMVQPDSGIDDRYVPHQVHCLTAYNLKGEILWQVGTPIRIVRVSVQIFQPKSMILIKTALMKFCV